MEPGAVTEDTDLRATPERAAEHYPGEPTPADMIRDLQEAVHGFSYATAHSPQQEWRELLRLVRTARARHV